MTEKGNESSPPTSECECNYSVSTAGYCSATNRMKGARDTGQMVKYLAHMHKLWLMSQHYKSRCDYLGKRANKLHWEQKTGANSAPEANPVPRHCGSRLSQ